MNGAWVVGMLLMFIAGAVAVARVGPNIWRAACLLTLPAVLGITGSGLVDRACAETIPQAAYSLRPDLEAEVYAYWGYDAPVALFAAQIHAESSWRRDAQSPYAQGLAQVTPSTARWLAEIRPAELSPPDPWNPRWSLRAAIIYDHWIYTRYSDRWESECDAWAAVLATYNGGWKWILTERAMARSAMRNARRWWGHVEMMRARSAEAYRENRAYPHRVINELQPRYKAAGWPGTEVCG